MGRWDGVESSGKRSVEKIMAWKKPGKELSKFLEESITSFDVKKKTMFGCPVFFA